jgi:hypothetical protein
MTKSTGSPPIWPPERVAELTRRWASGESFSAIGKAMGVSRGGIAGKLDRLGVDKRNEGHLHQTRKLAGAWSGARPGARKVAKVGKPARAIAGPSVALAEATVAIPFIECGRHRCHFPMDAAEVPGTADTPVCNERCEEGSSWCGFHQRIVYSPGPPSKIRAMRTW